MVSLAEYRAALERCAYLEVANAVEYQRRELMESAYRSLLDELGHDLYHAPVKYKLDKPILNKTNGDALYSLVIATPFISEVESEIAREDFMRGV